MDGWWMDGWWIDGWWIDGWMDGWMIKATRVNSIT